MKFVKTNYKIIICYEYLYDAILIRQISREWSMF